MKILNIGKKSPVLVLLGDVSGKMLEGFDATFVGAKTSETRSPEMATWLKFETAKDLNRFVDTNQLVWVK